MAAAVSLKKKIEGLGGGTKISTMGISSATYFGILILLKLQLFFFPLTYNARTQGYVSTKRAKKIIRERREGQ